MKWVVYVGFAVGVFIALSLFSFWLAVRPPRLTIPLAPADFKLAVEEIWIPTADGLRLSAWLVAKAGAPAIVLLHGYPAEKTDMLPLAAVLARRFTVLLVDLRYFGRSDGSVTTLGFRERNDLRRAIDALARRGFDRVGVFGFSLGGAIALTTAVDEPRIGAVAAYSPFADLRMLATSCTRGWGRCGTLSSVSCVSGRVSSWAPTSRRFRPWPPRHAFRSPCI